MKIGILGGTFDPPHIGHVHAACEARDKLKLDYCLMMPTGIGYEATEIAKKPVSRPLQRLQMVSLALQRYDRIYPSDFEVRQPFSNHTLDVAREFSAWGNDLWFIVGADTWNDIPNWEEPVELQNRASFAVIPRNGKELREDQFKPSYIFDTNPFDSISSTTIREHLREFKGTDYPYLHEDVYRYILLNDLYL